MRDDLDPRGKRHQAVDVIAIAVRNDGRRYRLGRNFGDFGEQILRACLRLLGINNNDARLANDDGAVSTRTAKARPHIGFQHFHRDRRRRLWRLLRPAESGAGAIHNYTQSEAKNLYV